MNLLKMEERVADSAIVVVFGASGDLAKRKLIPALYDLYDHGLLPSDFTVLGFARTEYSDGEFRELCYEGICQYMPTRISDETWAQFSQCLFYQPGSYDSREAFDALGERIEELDGSRPTNGNRIFYLSTPPSVFKPISTLLSETGLANQKDGSWARIIIEKPFGHDYASAADLNEHLLQHFDEDQIYRIDHYLGKETVQNILVFRFGNGIFEPIWNRNYVDHVQITVSEDMGIGSRGGYYDKSGAIRDMVQNHLMQLVALTAMEPPVAIDSKAVRDQKVNVLRAIKPLSREEVRRNVVRAQYRSGSLNDEHIPGYLEAKGVDPDSTTDTFIAWRLEIDNWRWNGVPFYLRTGKALPAKITEIVIVFRRPPLTFFSDLDDQYELPRNALTIRIQPDEGISLSFDAKRPGPVIEVEPVTMNFSYGNSFGIKNVDAYERLLHDALMGDGTLFIRRDEIEVAWDRVTRVLDAWSAEDESARRRGSRTKLPTYQPGTWGPMEAVELLARDARRWRNPRIDD